MLGKPLVHKIALVPAGLFIGGGLSGLTGPVLLGSTPVRGPKWGIQWLHTQLTLGYGFRIYPRPRQLKGPFLAQGHHLLAHLRLSQASGRGGHPSRSPAIRQVQPGKLKSHACFCGWFGISLLRKMLVWDVLCFAGNAGLGFPFFCGKCWFGCPSRNSHEEMKHN